jgi:hypothetical protein
VLPLAARIGESEIDVLDVVVLDHLQDFFGRAHGGIPLSSMRDWKIDGRNLPTDLISLSDQIYVRSDFAVRFK